MSPIKIYILLIVLSYAFCNNNCIAQINNDSIITIRDSLYQPDTIKLNILKTSQTTSLDSLLKTNKYINNESTISQAVKNKNKTGKEFLFYFLGIIVFLFALIKMFYAKYFNNIFRVFFNTSLRQNQLTDILLQSKLPSLIFNIFFVVSAGIYVWLLLDYHRMLNPGNNYLFIALSILFIGLLYTGKFLCLKLIGWISGMSSATDQYIFVIFLINKIIGIGLIPFIILIAFAPTAWLTPIIIFSFCIIGILFLLRYLRSYGLLQTQLKINRFHFVLYIVGVELLPIVIIYKSALKLLV
ncbi:MAG: DUF4271 domain-containing protein [Chitinophagaceae bacterium]